MQDKLQPVTVQVFYKAYKTVDVIETWTVISHQEKKAITLKRFDSGHLTLRQGDVWLTHLHGDWAAEANVVQEPLTLGCKVIRNTDGARNCPSGCSRGDALARRSAAGEQRTYHRCRPLLERQLRDTHQHHRQELAPPLCRHRPAGFRVCAGAQAGVRDTTPGTDLQRRRHEWRQP